MSLILLSQAWANLRSPTLRRSIANIFNSKKFIKIEGGLSIYGRSYRIYLIMGSQIGANFTGEICKMWFKTLIRKIFSKKKHPNPKTVKKIILHKLFCNFCIR